MVIEVLLYTREDCGLCDEAKKILLEIGRTFPLAIREVDIRQNPALEKAFFDRIPVVDIGGKLLEAPLSDDDLWRAAAEAHREKAVADRRVNGENRAGVGHAIAVALNKWLLSFARNWAAYLTALVLLYVGLPFVAPLAMHLGAPRVANVIYTVYGPVCHQFAFRSWYLFGEQAVYPRARAGVASIGSFEQYASAEPAFAHVDDIYTLDPDLTWAARGFKGSERMGWKVALCQRDTAIYGALALFGIVFIMLQKAGIRVPYLPFWAYVLLAIVPIGLDGVSQLLANPPFNGFGLAVYPIRESTPFLRTLTGALFGIGNGWLAYPYIQESMEETHTAMQAKLVRAGIIEAAAD